jgi:thiol-disulfide isomerase/thioredoxin
MKKVITSICSWVVFLLPIQLWAQESDQAILIVHGVHKNDLDLMSKISIMEYGINDYRINETIVPKIEGSSAVYKFTNIKSEKVFQIPRSISLNLSTVPFYLITPGDSINIFINKDQVSFTGKGHEKFEILYALFRIKQGRQDNEDNTIRSLINKNLEVLASQEDYLNKRRYSISENTFFKILNETRLYNQILNYGTLTRKSDGFENYIREYQQLLALDSKISNYLPAHFFAAYFIEKYKYEELKLKNKKFNFENAFRYIEVNSTGINKESLLTYLISRQLRSSSISNDQLLVLHDFKNDTLKGYIDILIKGRISGAKAPAFSLTGIDGKEFSSEKFSGKVLVLDFWFTGCGACQEIPPILGPLAEKYKDNKDVVFLSICIDKEMEKWKDSVKKGRYTFDNSIKLYTGGKGRNHPIMTDYTVSGCPTVLLISKSGRILSIPDSIRNDNGRSLENAIANELY